jgi:hypothetical protein
MQFTEKELRFLFGTKTSELGTGELVPGHWEDMRERGCPEALFLKIATDRARRSGKSFAEFRSKHGICNPTEFLASTSTAKHDASVKLF